MVYETKCPKCGSEELFVVQLFWFGKTRLREDGFSLHNADTNGTDQEIVQCKNCMTEFSLNELQR